VPFGGPGIGVAGQPFERIVRSGRLPGAIDGGDGRPGGGSQDASGPGSYRGTDGFAGLQISPNHFVLAGTSDQEVSFFHFLFSSPGQGHSGAPAKITQRACRLNVAFHFPIHGPLLARIFTK